MRTLLLFFALVTISMACRYDIFLKTHHTELFEPFDSKFEFSDDFETPDNSEKLFVGYFQSWSEHWSSTGKDSSLANLPSYVNAVIISFIEPGCSYAGGLSLGGTGLSFSSDGNVVKASIEALKAKNPNTKVLVAVGGATYPGWDGLNENAIAKFVKDFGIDGVDVDYEPANAGCTSNQGQVSCPSDKQFIDVVSRLRKALPKPYLLTIAGWSVGAYGQGKFQNAQPASAYTGLCVNLLKSEAGKSLDWINVMSYDASPAYDPIIGYEAYKSLFAGKVVIGVEVPPEAWGGHVLTQDELQKTIDYVNKNNGAGLMLWSIHKQSSGISTQQVAKTACQGLGLHDCDKPLLPWQFHLMKNKKRFHTK